MINMCVYRLYFSQKHADRGSACIKIEKHYSG